MSVLSINERWLLNLLDTIDEGIHAVDVDGVTLVYNQAAAAMDGLAQADVLGKHVLSVFPSLGQDTSTLMQVVKTGKSMVNRPQTYTNYLGLKVHTVNTTLPIVIAGKVVGAVEIAKDLTQVRNLSEQVLSLQAQVVGGGKRKSRTARSTQSTQAYYQFSNLLTQDDKLMEVKKRAELAAKTASPVLVFGETGTGKELLVQAIHNASARRTEPFLALNCAALPATLLEGILFGTVRGSFTGANDRAGLFELADGGTLFLDEIQSMPLDLQAKLLRVLQEGEILRVGDTRMRRINVRVIAAMNQSPETSVRNRELRQDLYYRINVVRLDLPPLRKRKADIPLLLKHFIDKWNGRFGARVKGVEDAVLQLFDQYPWPGNVRELENAIEAAMNLVQEGVLTMDVLPFQIREYSSGSTQWAVEGVDGHLHFTSEPLHEPHNEGSAAAAQSQVTELPEWAQELNAFGMQEFWDSTAVSNTAKPDFSTMTQAFERIILIHALNSTGGNVKQTAAKLGVPRQTLQYRLKQAGLTQSE